MPVLPPLTKNGNQPTSSYSTYSGNKNVLPPLTTNRKISSIPVKKKTTKTITATPTPKSDSQILGYMDRLIKEPIVGQSIKYAKQTIDEGIEFSKSFIKTAKEKPKKTTEAALAGVGVSLIKFGGETLRLIQQGYQSSPFIGVGVISMSIKPKIPEIWDMEKQVPAFNKLVEQKMKNKPIEEKNGFAVGQFIGSFIPYALTAELTGATIGSKVLLPTAGQFLPKAVKYIPTLNNAIAFMGLGQIQYDENVDESRANRLKNDLIMLAIFEVGGAFTRQLSKKTKEAISRVVNKSSKEIKGKQGADIDQLEKEIKEVKQIIKEDSGKSPEVIVSNTIAKSSDDQIKVIEKQSEVKFIPKKEKPKEIVSEKIIKTETTKKPPYNSKQAKIVNETVSNKLAKLNVTAKNEEDMIRQSIQIINKAISQLKGDRTGLSGLRTALNKELFRPVGGTKGADFKFKYKQLKTIMDDDASGIGKYLSTLENKIQEVDDLILKTKEVSKIVTKKTEKVITERKLQEPIGTGKTKQSRLGSRVEAEAIEKELAETLGELPEYKVLNLKKQSEKALMYTEENYQKAIDIAMGKKASPPGITPEAMFIAVKNKAFREKDIDLIKRLAQSPRIGEATAMGQRIASLRDLNKDDGIRVINRIIEERKKIFEQRYKNRSLDDMSNKVLEDIKKNTKTIDRYDWNNFIDSIKC